MASTLPLAATSRPSSLAQARTQAVAWVGVLSVAGASAWLATVGLRYLVTGHDLGRALASARGEMVGPALIVTVAVLVLAEQRWPAVRRPLLARAHIVDGCYFLGFAIAVVPVLTLVETGFALELERHAPFLVLGRLPLMPRFVVVALTLIGIDAMNWCAHVANHRFETLWRLHALHHSQEDMSVLTTFRTHPLVHATYLAAVLPALVLGASGTVPTAALIAYGCLVTLPHANLNWRLGPLGHVIVSPAYHRLHHRRKLGERGTVNFGFVLVLWDQLAGRAEFPAAAAAPVATGLWKRPVPVEQDVLSPGLPRVVLAQLAQPFRPNPTRSNAR
jgi:sterol desaturase/sphingolipid hydroxylase (fatty acid hydroxylase superfamily)